MGIELNADDLRFGPEEEDIVLRPYRIAMECGCKFYFGSDAHTPEGLVASPPLFERAVEYLNLEDSDIMKI